MAEAISSNCWVYYGSLAVITSANISQTALSMLGSIVAEKEVEKLVELGDHLPDHLGKRILQLFFMSTTNGSLCIPLAFYLSTGATGKWVYSVMRECIQKLHHFRIKITWGCSDMFAGCLEYVQLMSTSLEGCYQHVFDSAHLVKLGRNVLMDRILKNDDCPLGFSIQNLFTLWENDPIWKSRLTLDDLCIQQTR